MTDLFVLSIELAAEIKILKIVNLWELDKLSTSSLTLMIKAKERELENAKQDMKDLM